VAKFPHKKNDWFKGKVKRSSNLPYGRITFDQTCVDDQTLGKKADPQLIIKKTYLV
jgi:hypothetical protein